MNPLITVIIPVYNSEKTLGETLGSLLAQTYQNWEAFVVADVGTTDRTADRVKSFADPRISYIQLNNVQGLSFCRNYGIDSARGDWIAFLDSDDLWLPQKLEMQMKAVQSREADLCVTGFHRFSDTDKKIISINRPLKNYKAADLFKNNFVGCSTALVRKAKLGPIRFKNMHQEDFVFWLELLQNGALGIGLEEDLVGYRIVANSRSSRVNRPLNRWRIMRQQFNIGRLNASYYFLSYILTGILKRIQIK
jgi:teichuronic acid biosynthesis glycosyltransferase TuaG